MSDASAKQQIVDKVKSNTNILVTVSNNPSVDELSAALGLSLLLNKMKKHATAVFSGHIPPAITFLDPEKTFENTVDSLRDFIIALDKEKADHLRYKVEGDVVKIFITPYRTTITDEDLDFSQGDYNVELVLALGVQNKDNLDKALEAHGRILHDATVVTIMAGGEKSELGSISWQDRSASSLSEMAVTLSEALGADTGLIDQQIATAYLAGIVAATERFSNNRTSARVMTMAAQLMGAGANQQLIASKFEEADEGGRTEGPSVPGVEPAPPQEAEPPANRDGTTDLSEGESTKVDRNKPPVQEAAPPEETPAPPQEPNEPVDDGSLHISHEREGTLDEVAEQVAADNQTEAAQAAQAKLERQTQAAVTASQAGTATPAEHELSNQLPQVVAPATPDVSPADLQQDIAAATAEVDAAAAQPPLQGAVSDTVWQKANEPTLGGTLNATTEAAAEEKRRAEESDRNRMILNHGTGYIAEEYPTYSSPLNAASQPPEDQTMVNPLEGPGNPTVTVNPVQPPAPVASDVGNQTSAPAGLPPLPDFSTLPPMPPNPDGMMSEGAPSDRLGDILPPAPAALPEQNTPADPGQFRIPGQS